MRGDGLQRPAHQCRAAGLLHPFESIGRLHFSQEFGRDGRDGRDRQDEESFLPIQPILAFLPVPSRLCPTSSALVSTPPTLTALPTPSSGMASASCGGFFLTARLPTARGAACPRSTSPADSPRRKPR